MTLAPISGSFRPGGLTQPASVLGPQVEPAHLQFLTAEERSTAVLMGFFEQSRLDLEDFIRQSGDLTVSDATYYRKLLDETNRIASKVNAQGATWTSSTIPDAYSAGWRQNSSIVVPREALDALSRSTLGLITQTSDGIRQSVRNAIAQGILQGLSTQELNARILASGLSNIPHWPTVEYRAGVIARTETMRAYNEGNIAAVQANGAVFVEWIASPDEATCRICAPRDGHVFRLTEWSGPGDDPYPSALPIPSIPAHPRCRCTTRARYRDADGKVISAVPPEVDPPKLPTDAMGGKEEPKLPAAKGDIDKALRSLHTDFDAWQQGKPFPDATRQFWRGLDLDLPTQRRIAGLEGGSTVAQAKRDARAVMFARYGIHFETAGGWSKESIRASFGALEHWRGISPRYVVDSPYLTHWGSAPPGARKMTRSRAAEMYASCHMRPNFTAMRKHASHIDGYGIGYDDTIEFALTHELGHSIHNRYGAHSGGDLDRYAAIEYGGQIGQRGASGMSSPNYIAAQRHRDEFENVWRQIRQDSVGVAPSAKSSSSLKAIEDRIKSLEAQLAAATSPNATAADLWRSPGSLRAQIEMNRKLLADTKARAAKPGERYPTDYAMKSYMEDFAESSALYFLTPARLKEYSPRRYEFIRKLFGQ